MSLWALILIAASTAFLFRYIPMAFRRHSIFDSPDHPAIRFVTYSAQAMLGAISYEAVFGKSDLFSAFAKTGPFHIITASLCVVGFIASANGVALIKVLFVLTAIFILLNFGIPSIWG